MIRTRICDLLGIEYPIVQGGMLWLATAQLAAAVCNAGALGTISPCAGMEPHEDPLQNLRIQITDTRNLTAKPFAVNIPLDLPASGLLLDVIVKEKVGIVVTAAGDPAFYTDLLHSQGVKVLHVVSSVRQARKAADSHVDALIVEGVEAGGRLGLDELPLFSLLPQVAEAVLLPIIAAGGIVDARGMVAALALGAEGVQLGTRFVAVKENIAHPAYKKAIIEAKDTDTVVTSRRLLPARSLKTELSQRLLELEQGGASSEEIRNFLGRGRARKGQLGGNLVDGELHCGASAGLIKEILPAAEVIRRLIEGYREIVDSIA